MSLTIYKYRLQLLGRVGLDIPGHKKFLHVDMQDGELCVWAICDPDMPPSKRKVTVVGTGHSVPPHHVYIGTAMDGSFVWHAFEDMS